MVRKATTDLEVSVAPIQCIKAFRKLTEQAGWEIERHEGARLVDRFAIIFPMAQSTRTIGIKVLDGPLRGLELACWSDGLCCRDPGWQLHCLRRQLPLRLRNCGAIAELHPYSYHSGSMQTYSDHPAAH